MRGFVAQVIHGVPGSCSHWLPESLGKNVELRIGLVSRVPSAARTLGSRWICSSGRPPNRGPHHAPLEREKPRVQKSRVCGGGEACLLADGGAWRLFSLPRAKA